MSRLDSILLTQPWALHEAWLPLLVDLVERRLQMGIRFDNVSRAVLGSYRPDPMVLVPIDSEIDRADAPRGYSVFFGVEEPSAIEGDDGFLTVMSKGGEVFAAPTQASSTPSEGQKIAVINVMGPISQYPSMEMSGPSSANTEALTGLFNSAQADPTVRAIVFNIDSPGGGVYGVQEFFNTVMAARGQKPVIAQVSSLAASAAYWLAAAADEIVVTPSGQVGSIGVYTLHQDISGAMAAQGVKPTFISAGKYKVEGNQFAPLEGEAAEAMQSTVDGYYADFTAAVAKGRPGNATAQDVRNGYGQGRVLKAKDAVAANLADRVATLPQTLKRLGSTRGAAVTKANMMGELETGVSAHLPLVDHPAFDEVPPMMMNNKLEADGSKSVRLIGTAWPARAVVTSNLLSGEHPAEFITVGAGKLAFTVANGTAIYRISGRTHDDALVCDLQAGELEAFLPEDVLAPESPVTADPEAAAASDWRRRRHLHRMRQATR